MNPLGEYPSWNDSYEYDGGEEKIQGEKDDWNEAELRTFDRNRTLIFVKN